MKTKRKSAEEAIFKGNELIAQFEGFYPDPDTIGGYRMYSFAEDNNRTHVDLHYHTKPWQEPIIEKMSKMDAGHFVDVGCDSFESWRLQFVEEAESDEHTWSAIVEFVKEYNKTV